MKLPLLFIIVISVINAETNAQVDKVIPRVVLIADFGPDDAFALLVLLHAEKLGRANIEAIVCTMGNSDLKNTCKNVVRILEAAKRTDIPVYKGAYEPIVPLPENLTGMNFFGKDGFGDLEYEEQPDLGILRDELAPIALNRLVTNYPNEITIVCVSPLTTLGLTHLLFEEFASKVKDIWIMGGNFDGPGNINEDAEFNFFVDPESANIVLLNSYYPVKLFTWDACLAVDTTLDWRFSVLRKKCSPVMDLLNHVEQKVYQNTSLSTGWGQCDAFTAIAALYPETIVEQSVHKARVELHDKKTRGRLIFKNVNDNRMDIIIVQQLDTALIKNILLEVVDKI